MSYGAYSARVEIELNLNDQSLSVRQVAPEFIILQERVNHPPAEAEIVLRVDERTYRRKVFLPDGLSEACVRTPVATVA